MITLSYIIIVLCLVGATGLIMHADGHTESGFLSGILGFVLYAITVIAIIFNAMIHDVNVHTAAQCASTKHFEMGGEDYIRLEGEFVRCKDLEVMEKRKKTEETKRAIESCSSD